MRIDVDNWDPSYGASFAAGEGPQTESSAKVETGVELPATAWRAMEAPAAGSAPDLVLLVEGVQRIDTRVWITDEDGETHLGLAAAFAPGEVRCDLRVAQATLAASRI